MEEKNKDKPHSGEIMDTTAKSQGFLNWELKLKETSNFKNSAVFPVKFHVLKELISPVIQNTNTGTEEQQPSARFPLPTVSTQIQQVKFELIHLVAHRPGLTEPEQWHRTRVTDA